MPEDNNLVPPKEAARILGVTERILESWRFRGLGPRFVKMGIKCVRYHPLELEQYVASRTVDPATLKGRTKRKGKNALTDADLDRMAIELRGGGDNT